MTYQLRATRRFGKDIKALDPPVRARIDAALIELTQGAPYKSTKRLHGALRCKRTLRVGKYRVVLTICDECLNTANCRAANMCERENHSRNDILLHWLDVREGVY